jgi:RNA polymerase sigma-70 factor (ECF subfamily)
MQTRNSKRADEMFHAVYEEFHTDVPFFANHILDNPEEARDISTDTFIKLWVLRESFQSTDKMKSFLIKCTKNACLNRLKSVKRRRARQYEVVQLYYTPGTTEIMETFAESREAALIRVIKSLDMKYQECIWLFYFEKMTCAKIASRLNLSKRNVWFFLSKGRGIIKLALSSN